LELVETKHKPAGPPQSLLLSFLFWISSSLELDEEDEEDVEDAEPSLQSPISVKKALSLL
jgi:hypothetical protein